MALSNEDLLAISQLLDIKLKSALQAELQPLKDDIRYIKLHLENETDKRIQLLAENYVPAAKRYEKAVPEIEAMQAAFCATLYTLSIICYDKTGTTNIDSVKDR